MYHSNLISYNFTVTPLLNDEDAQIICNNLKYNRDESNVNEIFAKWTSSAHYRIKWINSSQESNIDYIINEWPAYSQTYGPRLIDIDFNQMYPDAESIFLKFDRFCSDVILIMEAKVTEPTAKQMLKDFKQQKFVSLGKQKKEKGG